MKTNDLINTESKLIWLQLLIKFGTAAHNSRLVGYVYNTSINLSTNICSIKVRQVGSFSLGKVLTTSV